MHVTPQITEFKQRLKDAGIKGLALDIDETLSWTVGYWMEMIIKIFGNPAEGLTVHELVEKYRYTFNVPTWDREEVRNWVEDAIHSEELHEEIPLIENANTMVQKINEIIPIVAYITARPESITEVTKRWLAKHNFPMAELIMKPVDVPVFEGSKWKAGVLQYLAPEVLGIIDDNPHLPEHIGFDYPGIIFLYNNSSHANESSNIIPCQTWDDVLAKVAGIV